MKRAAASSYDIVLARDLSRRLTGRGETPVDQEWMEDVAEYVRFQVVEDVPQPAAAQPEPQPPAPAEGVVEIAEDEVEEALDENLLPQDFVTWGDMLHWILAVSKARSAFVLDSDGFVVANLGVEPSNGFEGIGAELSYALEQLGRIDPQSGLVISTDMAFKGWAIYAFNIRVAETVRLTVGIVSDWSLDSGIKDLIYGTTTLYLSKMV